MSDTPAPDTKVSGETTPASQVDLSVKPWKFGSVQQALDQLCLSSDKVGYWFEGSSEWYICKACHEQKHPLSIFEGTENDLLSHFSGSCLAYPDAVMMFADTSSSRWGLREASSSASSSAKKPKEPETVPPPKSSATEQSGGLQKQAELDKSAELADSSRIEEPEKPAAEPSKPKKIVKPWERALSEESAQSSDSGQSDEPDGPNQPSTPVKQTSSSNSSQPSDKRKSTYMFQANKDKVIDQNKSAAASSPSGRKIAVPVSRSPEVSNQPAQAKASKDDGETAQSTPSSRTCFEIDLGEFATMPESPTDSPSSAEPPFSTRNVDTRGPYGATTGRINDLILTRWALKHNIPLQAFQDPLFSQATGMTPQSLEFWASDLTRYEEQRVLSILKQDCSSESSYGLGLTFESWVDNVMFVGYYGRPRNVYPGEVFGFADAEEKSKSENDRIESEGKTVEVQVLIDGSVVDKIKENLDESASELYGRMEHAICRAHSVRTVCSVVVSGLSKKPILEAYSWLKRDNPMIVFTPCFVEQAGIFVDHLIESIPEFDRLVRCCENLVALSSGAFFAAKKRQHSWDFDLVRRSKNSVSSIYRMLLGVERLVCSVDNVVDFVCEALAHSGSGGSTDVCSIDDARELAVNLSQYYHGDEFRDRKALFGKLVDIERQLRSGGGTISKVLPSFMQIVEIVSQKFPTYGPMCEAELAKQAVVFEWDIDILCAAAFLESPPAVSEHKDSLGHVFKGIFKSLDLNVAIRRVFERLFHERMSEEAMATCITEYTSSGRMGPDFKALKSLLDMSPANGSTARDRYFPSCVKNDDDGLCALKRMALVRAFDSDASFQELSSAMEDLKVGK